jgi:excisionase family DNA binding protein
MKYRLLNRETVDLGKLPREDLAFLLDLQRRAIEDEDYFAIERAVCGPGAYPLKGSARVTREIHCTPLFLVAEDVAYRAGIRQGVIAPNDDDEMVPTDGIISVSEAARQLGITRSAVVKAAQAGRLRGKKIGKTWALWKRSVEGYRVAEHRVVAGKAAHQRAGMPRRQT